MGAPVGCRPHLPLHSCTLPAWHYRRLSAALASFHGLLHHWWWEVQGTGFIPAVLTLKEYLCLFAFSPGLRAPDILWILPGVSG